MKNICILLLNYNGTNDTIDCIRSIEEIDSKNFNVRVVIVDNKSNEYEYRNLENFLINNNLIKNDEPEKEKYFLIKNDKNIGFAAGNNKGIRFIEEYFSIDYYLLLNNDTILEADSIEKLLTAFDDEKVGAASGLILDYETKSKIWYAGGKISRLKSKGQHTHYGVNVNELNLANHPTKFLSGCYVMFKRDALFNIRLLNEQYFFGTEEYDYSLKLDKLGYKMMFIADSVIYHKVKIEEGNGSSHDIKDPIYIYNSMRNKYLLNYNNYNSITTFFWLIITKIYIKKFLLKRLNLKRHNLNMNENTIEVLYENFRDNIPKKYIDSKEFNDVRLKFKQGASNQ